MLIYKFYSTPFHVAVEKGNFTIIQLLYERNEIDINAKSILLFFFFINRIKSKCFNGISN